MAMTKKTVYRIFVAKFVFSLAMIFWTIKMTIGAGVGQDDDNTFMSNYHNVDDNYNEMIISNHNFANKYNIEVKINNYTLNSLDIKDIYLSQRVIKKREDKKSILNIGENKVTVFVYDKITNKKVKEYSSDIVFTMPSTHKHDQKINVKNDSLADIKIDQKTFWNIMGTISVGSDIGRFYLKTNAI